MPVLVVVTLKTVMSAAAAPVPVELKMPAAPMMPAEMPVMDLMTVIVTTAFGQVEVPLSW